MKPRKVLIKKSGGSYAFYFGSNRLSSAFCEEFERVTGFKLGNGEQVLAEITVTMRGEVRPIPDYPHPAPEPDGMTIREAALRYTRGLDAIERQVLSLESTQATDPERRVFHWADPRVRFGLDTPHHGLMLAIENRIRGANDRLLDELVRDPHDTVVNYLTSYLGSVDPADMEMTTARARDVELWSTEVSRMARQVQEYRQAERARASQRGESPWQFMGTRRGRWIS